MNIHITIAVPPDAEHYLDSSARLRNMSKAELLRRVVDIVLKDCMILSVLDDADDVTKATAPSRPVGRPNKAMQKPADKVFNDVTRTPVPAPKAWAATTHTRRKNASERTKAEMYADLRQAVENT